MADAVLIEFAEAVTQDVYDQIDGKVNPPGNPPEGMIFHSAGPSPSENGGWRVVDVWESREVFEEFMSGQVLPTVREIVGEDALREAEPPIVSSWPIHHFTIGV